MRLLYVCNDFGIRPCGTKGASVHLRSITRALTQLGHEVLLLNPHGDAGPDHPARALLNPCASPIKNVLKPLKQWLVDNELGEDIARDLRPLTFGPWASQQAIEVLKDNPPDAIIERLALFSGIGLDLSKHFDCPLLIEVNAILSEEARVHRTLVLADLAQAIERKVLGEADGVVAVSQALCDRLSQDFCEPRRVTFAPNGADPELFDTQSWRLPTRQSLGLAEQFVVGFVGTLKPWHGIDVLLDAFVELEKRRPDVRLLIVGDGPCAEVIQERKQQCGLQHKILTTGAVPAEEVAKYLAAMDVAVAPYREAHDCYFSPMKVFESMAAGVCSVASAAGQLPDIISDGCDGRLVPPGDADALVQALRELAGNASLRHKLAQAGRDTIRKNYTWGHTARIVLGALERAQSSRLAPSLTLEQP